MQIGSTWHEYTRGSSGGCLPQTRRILRRRRGLVHEHEGLVCTEIQKVAAGISLEHPSRHARPSAAGGGHHAPAAPAGAAAAPAAAGEVE
jgi:hypothetical protein